MCSHTIGLLNSYNNTHLINMADLKCEIFDGTFDIDTFKHRDYTEKEKLKFFDWRCSTHITRFKFCPDCGEEINWAKIKKEILEE